MPELIRAAAAEGAVLLKNDGVLPYSKEKVISVFGRVQYNYFATGYGSGGDVRKPYVVNLIDGLKACEELSINDELAEIYKTWATKNVIDHGYWAHWPRSYPEMPLTEKIVDDARAKSEEAIVVLGRSAGEDRENALEKGECVYKIRLVLFIKKSLDLFTCFLIK